MDYTEKTELILLAAIIVSILVKLFFFALIPKRKAKLFFRSFAKWYKLAYMMEDINDKVEKFLSVSNYCNLVIWIGTGVLAYLIGLNLLFPEQ